MVAVTRSGGRRLEAERQVAAAADLGRRFAALPPEVLDRVFAALPKPELFRIRTASRFFRRAASSHLVGWLRRGPPELLLFTRIRRGYGHGDPIGLPHFPIRLVRDRVERGAVRYKVPGQALMRRRIAFLCPSCGEATPAFVVRIGLRIPELGPAMPEAATAFQVALQPGEAGTGEAGTRWGEHAELVPHAHDASDVEPFDPVEPDESVVDYKIARSTAALGFAGCEDLAIAGAVVSDRDWPTLLPRGFDLWVSSIFREEFEADLAEAEAGDTGGADAQGRERVDPWDLRRAADLLEEEGEGGDAPQRAVAPWAEDDFDDDFEG